MDADTRREWKTRDEQAAEVVVAALPGFRIGHDPLDTALEFVQEVTTEAGYTCFVKSGGLVHLLLCKRMENISGHRRLRRARAIASEMGTALTFPAW